MFEILKNAARHLRDGLSKLDGCAIKLSQLNQIELNSQWFKCFLSRLMVTTKNHYVHLLNSRDNVYKHFQEYWHLTDYICVPQLYRTHISLCILWLNFFPLRLCFSSPCISVAGSMVACRYSNNSYHSKSCNYEKSPGRDNIYGKENVATTAKGYPWIGQRVVHVPD